MEDRMRPCANHCLARRGTNLALISQAFGRVVQTRRGVTVLSRDTLLAGDLSHSPASCILYGDGRRYTR